MKYLILVFLLFLVVSCSTEPAVSNVEITDVSVDVKPDNTKPDETTSDNTKLEGDVTGTNWFLPYPKPSKYKSYGGDWTDQIKNEWRFYKKEMIDNQGIDLAVKNNGKTYAFSEGIAYGLIFSLYMNDQEYFQKIFTSAEKLMRLESGYYGWKLRVLTKTFELSADRTSASDAEIEIAYALLSASKLVDRGYWDEFKSSKENFSKGQTYKERGLEILDLVLNQDSEDDQTQIRNDIILPGDGASWGLTSRFNEDNMIIYNPSYFMPAYMREFNSYKQAADWERVLAKGYRIMDKWEGSNKGVAPDWCDGEGQVYSYGAATRFSSQRKQYSMYLDAIRVPMRIGVDAIWYDNQNAKNYCNNVANYVDSWEKAGYYMMDGHLLTVGEGSGYGDVDLMPGNFTWMLETMYEYSNTGYDEQGDLSTTSFPSLAMWMVAILGSDASDNKKNEFVKKFKNTWVENGRVDALSEDRMPRFGITDNYGLAGNHYFVHSLSMFGSLIAAGAFPNILEDLK